MTTEIYQPQNLPPESFNAIKQLYIDTMATLEGATLEVDYLKAAIKNTKIIDPIWYVINIDEKVNPVTKEYNINNILAVVGLIFVILADRITTKTISIIAKVK